MESIKVVNMESPGAAGRRRGTSRSNVEDQALDQIAKEVSHVTIILSKTQILRHGHDPWTVHNNTFVLY